MARRTRFYTVSAAAIASSACGSRPLRATRPSRASAPLSVTARSDYVRGNAGKTCILAALAMPRLANPGHFSCSWVDRPGPGDMASLGVRDPSAMVGFERGRAWIERAIWHLEHYGEVAPFGGGESERSRGVPPPNPNESDAFRLQYRFTAPDRGSFLVELIDYSGELIDPDLSETELSKRLRHHMAETDALFVLASAPRPGEEGAELVRELERLKRAFAALRGEGRRDPDTESPVAMALNKWDLRQSREAFLADPDLVGEGAYLSKPAVRDFLAGSPEPPHIGLVDALSGAVGAANFKIFPLSALGEPEIGGDVTHPDRPGRAVRHWASRRSRTASWLRPSWQSGVLGQRRFIDLELNAVVELVQIDDLALVRLGRADGERVGANYVAVARGATQHSTGRPGRVVLALVGVDTAKLSADERNLVVQLLRDLLVEVEAVSARHPWSGEQRLVVPFPEISVWLESGFSPLRNYTPANGPQELGQQASRSWLVWVARSILLILVTVAIAELWRHFCHPVKP